ncbi:motility associated factor glycosyltransferase family protein [Paenibacillus segetis]|uniref:DUF115 domain-containing protein n=1 Tax=Paenibacillus segetis TaxID=1325360 RepID=A0ABQ1YQE0_9BACL|nr:6-hydroxymethylpterin diphosphokinase MptE-like protein [Paenibacillus segetis]GGH33047.1 hypothetical protein GCM10008013_37850 [Paenibacillus segetis]
MKIIDNNIKYLRANYPELLKVVKGNAEHIGYELTVTKNQEPNLVLVKDNKTFYLHSKYNAVEEAKKWIISLGAELLQVEHLLIIGCGMGYYLDEVLECSTASNIYVYEPDIHIFNAWVHSRDVQKVLTNQRIRLFVVGEDDLLQTQFTMHISEYANKSMSIIAPPIYNKLFHSIIDNVQHKMKESLYIQMVNQVTMDTFQREWVANILYNLPYVVISTPASKLKGGARDVPVIIVGSGPSLQYDISYLRDLQSKCLVIAAGSSIQALEHHGIIPHMVVSIDGGIWNYKVFENVDTSKSPLLYSPQINHKVLEHFDAPLIVAALSYDSVTPKLVEAEAIPVFRSATSVTGIALQVAAYMGATEIVLMGQDLSYPDKQFYSSGVTHISEEQIAELLSDATELIPNVDGGQNSTTMKMKITLDDMELQIKLISLNNVKIINSSRHGAVIEGTEWIAMDDLARRWGRLPKVDFDLHSLLIHLTDEEKLVKLNQLKVEFNSLSKQTKDFGKRIKDLLSNINTLADKLANSNIKTISSRLVEIDRLWTRITRQPVFETVYSFSLRHYINNYMKHVTEIVETENVRSKSTLIVNHLGTLVRVMDDFTPELIEILSDAINRLNSLLDEKGEKTS